MESRYDKRRNFIINSVYLLLLVLIIYVALKYVLILISPFLFAFFIAFLLKRPSIAIASTLRISPRFVAVILVFVFYITIGGLLSLLGVKVISTVTRIIADLPITYEQQIEPFLSKSFDGIEQAVSKLDPAVVTVLNDNFDKMISSLGDNVTKISLSLVGNLSNFASALPGFLIKILITIISTFFIAGDYDKLTKFVLRQFPRHIGEIILKIKQFLVGTLFVVIRSYAIIMSITFVELSIGLSLIGIKNAVLIALLIAFFDIMPVLGTGGVMIPWIIFTLVQGNFKVGIGLLVVYVFVTVIRNILEPKIVGSQLGLHPIVSLMSMFVGVSLFGVIGLFGFPITLSLLKHLNDSGIIKVFK